MMTLHDLPDHGFADAEAAMVAVRRLKLRQKLQQARASVARVLEHLDVISQPDRRAASASGEQRLDLAVGGGEGDLREVGIFDRDGKRMRERELLEGLDAVNEFLDLLAGDVGHGVFSVVRFEKPISEGLEKAWSWGKKFVEETDWEAVGKGLATAVETLVKIVELLGRASAVADDIATNGLVTQKTQRTLPEKPSDPWSGIFRFKSDPQPGPAAKPPAARKLSSNLTSGAAGGLKVGGALKIDVTGAPGLAVRATPVTGPGTNLPMEVRTGRTMRSAA